MFFDYWFESCPSREEEQDGKRFSGIENEHFFFCIVYLEPGMGGVCHMATT